MTKWMSPRDRAAEIDLLAEVICLVKHYLKDASAENEEVIYRAIKRLISDRPEIALAKKLLRLRLFLYRHKQQEKNREQFKAYVKKEQKAGVYSG